MAQASAQDGASLDRRNTLLKGIHIPFVVTLAFLIAYGVTVVYSASLSIADASWTRQLIGVAIGAVAAIVAWRFEIKRLVNMTRLLLALVVILMLAPLLPGIGVEAQGLTGWVRIPGIPFNFQPAELAKIVTILLMAALVSQYNGKITDLKEYLKLLGVLAIPFLLIMLQPDLGTGLIILVLGATIIVMGGAKKEWVLITLAIVVALVALVLITDPLIDARFGDSRSLLKQYQMNRLLVFADPSLENTDAGYNLKQSKIAIGSGEFVGKGFGNASQAGEGFLPAAHTDFVFALLSEQFGFVGGVALLVLFSLLIFYGFSIASAAGTLFETLTVFGILGMWLFQILESIGMSMGLMPITGIPLPFISYGPSSMVVQLLAAGIVLSVWRGRSRVNRTVNG